MRAILVSKTHTAVIEVDSQNVPPGVEHEGRKYRYIGHEDPSYDEAQAIYHADDMTAEEAVRLLEDR